jgi:hypothetical protein
MLKLRSLGELDHGLASRIHLCVAPADMRRGFDMLAAMVKDFLAETMRRHEGTGRPLGDRRFLERLGRRLGRDLVPKKPGPAPKKKTKQGS